MDTIAEFVSLHRITCDCDRCKLTQHLKQVREEIAEGLADPWMVSRFNNGYYDDPEYGAERLRKDVMAGIPK